MDGVPGRVGPPGKDVSILLRFEPIQIMHGC